MSLTLRISAAENPKFLSCSHSLWKFLNPSTNSSYYTDNRKDSHRICVKYQKNIRQLKKLQYEDKNNAINLLFYKKKFKQFAVI